MEITALIMAGGRGERFWPRSRKTMPKQFLSLTGDGKTMLQLVVECILPLLPIENIYIATNQMYKALVKEQLPQLDERNILCEPVPRNTAPCIGVGATHIVKHFGDALMLVLPSDHLIESQEKFLKAVKSACRAALVENTLVTIGIKPERPETGYGYIKYNTNNQIGEAYPVDKFIEKPDLERAKQYLDFGGYLWNSGMFIWKASSILNAIEEFLSEIFAGLMRIRSALATPNEEDILQREFSLMEAQSIDYGIMEKSPYVYTVPGKFGWDDVGSWLATERIQGTDEEGNVLAGNVLAVNTYNCILQGNEKLIAAVGLKDIVVVDTEDATLICSRGETEHIRQILSKLKESGRERYL